MIHEDEIGSRLKQSTIWTAGAEQASDGFLHAGFYRSLRQDGAPSQARLHLFAYTRYQLFVNGRYIGRGPARFENRAPEYDTWPLNGIFVEGLNTLAVLVHRDAPGGRVMQHAPGFCALLVIDEQDGRQNVYATDSEWTAFPEPGYGFQPLAWGSYSENLNAQVGLGPWFDRDFQCLLHPRAVAVNTANSLAWPDLKPRSIPLLREEWIELISENTAEYRTHSTMTWPLPDGTEALFSAERICLGYHVAEFEATAGSVLEISYFLPDGPALGVCTFTARAGRQVWIGGDVWSFRNLRLRVCHGTVHLHRLHAVEVLYPLEIRGSFHCSNAILCRLWQIGARTVQLLSEDAYTDCADRERVEWMDNDPPAFDVTRIAMAGPPRSPGSEVAWGDPRLMRAMLRRVALTQREDGMLKEHTCSERWDLHAVMEDRACMWIEGLRKYFEATGDREFLRAHWPVCERLVRWFLQRKQSSGLVCAREWATWDNPLAYATGECTILNCFVVRAFIDASWLASQLGDAAAEQLWREEGGTLSEAINEELWLETVGAYGSAKGNPVILPQDNLIRQKITLKRTEAGLLEPTLHANLFALNRGVVPAERRSRVIAWVLNHQSQITQIMAQQFLWELLHELDTHEHDAAVIANLLGWQAMVDSPWQTSWEMAQADWGSKIHIYGTMPTAVLSSRVLGVRRVAPVWERTVEIEPRLGSLEIAEGVVITEFGPIEVKWCRGANSVFAFEIAIPREVCAIVSLPAAAGTRLILNGVMDPAVSQGRWLRLRLRSGDHRGKVLPAGLEID